MLTLEIIIDHREVITTDYFENFLNKNEALEYANGIVEYMCECCQLTLLHIDKTIFFKSRGKHAIPQTAK